MMNALEVARLMSIKKCTYQGCGTKFPDGIIHLKGKWGKNLSWSPDAQYLFHYQDTHGVPHEMIIEEITQCVTREMTDIEMAVYNELMKEAVKV